MKKILVVEDDFDIRESIIDILELNDFDAYPAANGQEGFDLIGKNEFDLVLCDINMPKMNGYELLEKINLEISDAPKVILLTAKVEKQDIQKGLDLGALEYILKPFSHVFLVERMRHHIKNN